MARNTYRGSKRFVSWAGGFAVDAVLEGESLNAAVEIGFQRTIDEAEHGGIGIGFATVRHALKNRVAVEQATRDYVWICAANSVARGLQGLLRSRA